MNAPPSRLRKTISILLAGCAALLISGCAVVAVGSAAVSVTATVIDTGITVGTAVVKGTASTVQAIIP